MKITQIRKIRMACSALVVAGATWVWAAGSVSPTATMSVPTMLDISIAPAGIDFGAITLADFTAGQKTLSASNTVTVLSNGPNAPAWSVALAANAATWTGPWAKPAAELLVKRNTDGAGWTTDAAYTAFNALSTSSATYATGTRGSRTSTQDYKVLLNLANDIPGSYSLSITYTASTL